MSDYEHSLPVHASADMVFRFVSDVGNMPQYLPTVHSANPQGGERVRVQGNAAGHPYDSDGWFRVDQKAKRMEWGSDGENRYTGWLQVQPDAHGSKVTVHLSFEPRQDQAAKFEAQAGDRDAAIQDGLRRALESIRNICEGKGGKVDLPKAA